MFLVADGLMIDLTQLLDAPDDLAELLQVYARKYALWKERTSYRRQQTLEQAFPVWWIMQGPVNFRTTEDQLQFRALLYAALVKDAPSA